MFITNSPTEAEWAALDKSDHSSRALSVVAINGIFLALTLAVIGLRLFTKLFMAAKLSLDDCKFACYTFSFTMRSDLPHADPQISSQVDPFASSSYTQTILTIPCTDLMTTAAAIYTAYCVINIRAVHLGFGHHVWDLSTMTTSSTLADLTEAAAPVELHNYIALILVAPAIILAKLSVLLILLRVFPNSMRGLRMFLIALGVVLTLCCVTQAFLVAFQCSPIQASWNVWSADGEQACFIEPLQAVTMALGALNVLTDLAICITPIPYFWRLNISRAQKMCLCAVFASGLM